MAVAFGFRQRTVILMNHVNEKIKRLSRPVDLTPEACAGPLHAHKVVNFFLEVMPYGALESAVEE